MPETKKEPVVHFKENIKTEQKQFFANDPSGMQTILNDSGHLP